MISLPARIRTIPLRQVEMQGSASDASNYIGVDKAKELALQDAGIDSSAATFYQSQAGQRRRHISIRYRIRQREF